MYSTKSAFLIQKNSEQSSGGGGLMGMISGAGGSSLSDGSSVLSYLTSIEAMIRLDEDHDFIAYYSDPPLTLWPALKRMPLMRRPLKLSKNR